jgi:predicted negative regulator of RcsB-dependent stress response
MAKRARNMPGVDPSERKSVAIADTGDGTERAMELLDRVTAVYEENKKNINTGASVVLIIAVAIFIYLKMYKEPNDDKAAAAMAYPQLYYSVDSLNMAINGDGKHKGFEKLAKQYSGTPSGNLANFYEGIIYLKSGDFQKAIKSLQSFDGKGTLLAYQAWGGLGQAYMETGNKAKAIEYLKKATGNSKDKVLTPLYLYQLGVIYAANNNTKDAKDAFKRVKDEYPNSMQAKDIERELAGLGELD